MTKTALAHAPQQLDLFQVERWPHKPYTKREKDSPRYIRQLSSIIAHPEKVAYIQPNAPAIIFRMPFDLDRPDAGFHWEDKNLAAPNWIARNAANGHAHLCYEIAIPIKLVVEEWKPGTHAMRFLAIIEGTYRRQLDADPAYSGHFVKNPLCPRWQTRVLRTAPYDLHELADWVELPKKLDRRKRPELDSVAGRNCYLFERLRRWAYQAVRNFWQPGGQAAFMAALDAQAVKINADIEGMWPAKGPLHFPEMGDVVKSIGNWTWDHFTPAGWREYVARTHTPAVQARRGRLGGLAKGAAYADRRAQALALRADGRSVREIAEALGLDKMTVIRWSNNPTP